MAADDEFEPALIESNDTGVESTPVTKTVPGAASAVEIPPQAADNPEDGPRAQRVWNPKSRAMFRELVAKVKAGEVSMETDDLVPVDHATAAETPAPAEKPALVPATASPAAQAAAAVVPPPVPIAPTPQPRPDVGKVADEQRKVQLDLREKQIAEREAKLAELEKQLPSRDKFIETPIPTLAQYIRDSYGITDDAELKDTITDIMTELSETYHGVKLPDEIRTRVDSRKALRSVKAYNAKLERERAGLKAQAEAAAAAVREEQEKANAAAYETQAVTQLTGLIEQHAASYPYLAVQDGHAAIVWEVLKEQHNRGLPTDWASAAKYANDYYKNEHEQSQAEHAKRATRLQTLLAPVATPAPAQPAASPGGAPGPAPKQPAQAVTPQSQPAPSEPQPSDEDIVGMDRHERRARSARALLRKHGLGGATAR